MKHSGIAVDQWNSRVQAQIAAQMAQDAARKGTRLQPIPAPTPEARKPAQAIPAGTAKPVEAPLILDAGKVMLIHLPLHVISEANKRSHWAEKARRVKAQREAVAALLGTRLRGRGKPQTIFLVRKASRNLDTDNLQSAFKAVRDELAAQLGFDDRDPAVQWFPSQIQETKGRSILLVIDWP